MREKALPALLIVRLQVAAEIFFSDAVVNHQCVESTIGTGFNVDRLINNRGEFADAFLNNICAVHACVLIRKFCAKLSRGKYYSRK